MVSDVLIALEELGDSITESTLMASVMFANNGTGVLQVVNTVGEIC